MLRTIWWQNADASISKRRTPSPPGRCQRASTTRRTSDTSSPRPLRAAAERREVVLADERVAPEAQHGEVERGGDAPGGGGQERIGHGAVEDRVPVGARAGREPGVERRGHDRRVPHHDLGARTAVDRTAPGPRRRPRATAASKLTTWPQACTPASVRPAPVSSTGWRSTRSSASVERAGDGRHPGVGREAVEARSVVGHDHARHPRTQRARTRARGRARSRARPADPVVDGDDGGSDQFDARHGALSPWRGPSFRMRV